MEIEITDDVFVMPKKVYGDERKFYFEMLANHFNIREIELRVFLSNVFVFMARWGRRVR